MLLQGNQLAIIPTDTIYGISCKALSRPAVEKIYKLKQREENKPCVILIGKLKQLRVLGINPDETLLRRAQRLWKEKPTSIIFPCLSMQLRYLHRDTNQLAIRLPYSKQDLVETLLETGPIVSTSANVQGKPPVTSIDQARKVFGEAIDIYVDGGVLEGAGSRIIKIKNDKIVVLRE